MPRQTSETSGIIFPDGFKLEISTDGTTGSTWKEVGVLAGGANITLNWTDYHIDAGNYVDLVDKAKDPMVALAPSAVWNFDPAVIAALFPGFLKSTAATDPGVGFDVEYNGTSNQVTLTRSKLRLTHYSDDNLTTEDWQFTLNNATIDAGASFNMKGMNEDGLDELTVSFTGKCDPADSFKLFTFFKLT